MTGIYGIKNKINGKIYVGQSINIPRRWHDHKKRSKQIKYRNRSSLIYKAFAKYGLDNFDFIILEECDKEQLNEKEIYWINKYDSRNKEKGYNIAPGGRNNFISTSLKLTEEKANQIKKSLVKTTLSQSAIAEQFDIDQSTVSLINTGEIWYDKKLKYPLRSFQGGLNYYKEIRKNNCIDCGKEISKTAERCLECHAIYQRTINRPLPLELAKMIVEKGFTGVGRQFNVTDNAIKKWCKAYNIPYLKSELEEWYYKQIGKELPPKKEKVKIRKVKQIDIHSGETTAIFNSTREAGRVLGKTNGSHIGDVCNGKRQTAYGFKWEYIEE